MFLLSGLATASQISQIKVTSSLMSELVAAIAATTQDTQNNITLCLADWPYHLYLSAVSASQVQLEFRRLFRDGFVAVYCMLGRSLPPYTLGSPALLCTTHALRRLGP
jgi:hypothetical protein